MARGEESQSQPLCLFSSQAYPVLSVPRFALMMDAQTEEQGRPQETVNMSLELHDVSL